MATILVAESETRNTDLVQQAGFQIAGTRSGRLISVSATACRPVSAHLLETRIDHALDAIPTIENRFGTPSICLVPDDQPALREVLQRSPSAILIDPVQPTQLHATIELLLKQRSRQQRIGTSAKQLANRLNSLADALGGTDLLLTQTEEQDSSLLSLLSPRERDVISFLRRGMRVPEIASTLEISPHTVRNHLKAVFKKLGVRSQVELLSQLGRPGG